ncbi:2-hydroxychromene-2-carboxylate isomerase [Paracoccus sp. Z330]|uniref:2-hydroxychromene-2-carboxylate isomerase n=1 Tax=Paracoccus onchidii TaxID=3017813 RepID=A0ABT4ZKN4_9RHOB|nr:2-hydroxychromene-2-carboxylate isomerase [Paracoccus onchidii]MDB6179642.1 2-hydroxychromene-2-carboxylate isomerase [Paracoccus onchidii]
MADTIDYYYGMLSPFAFLGHDRFVALAASHGKKINFKPADFIERIFARTGGLKLHDRSEARQAYRLKELARWSKELGVPMNLQPRHFPVADELAARFAISVNGCGLDTGAFTHAVLTAVWQEERNVADPKTLVAIADTLGMSGRDLLTEAQSETALAGLERNCDEAVASGVFGTPSYAYEGEVFWGQDRLQFLEAALQSDA